MNHSTPGLSVHHQLPEFTQTHVHEVSDAIQLDYELLIAKFRLKLKKVGKTTTPFRYDLIKSHRIIQWK